MESTWANEATRAQLQRTCIGAICDSYVISVENTGGIDYFGPLACAVTLPLFETAAAAIDESDDSNFVEFKSLVNPPVADQCGFGRGRKHQLVSSRPVARMCISAVLIASRFLLPEITFFTYMCSSSCLFIQHRIQNVLRT